VNFFDGVAIELSVLTLCVDTLGHNGNYLSVFSGNSMADSSQIYTSGKHAGDIDPELAIDAVGGWDALDHTVEWWVIEGMNACTTYSG